MTASTMKLAGRNTAIAVDAFDLTGNYNEYKFKRDADLIDVTTFGERFSDYLAGIQKSNIELKGFYTPGYNNLDQIIHQRFGQDADVNVLLAPGGYKALGPALLVPTCVVKYDLSTKLKEAVQVDSEFAVRGAVDDGTILVSPTGFTTGTGASQVLDNTLAGGDTAAGCSGQLHVFSATGTTPSLAVKIQQSEDGSVWTDLITFTAATTSTAQRIVLPVGTTVGAQIKATWTVTGTGASFKALVGFARGVTYS